LKRVVDKNLFDLIRSEYPEVVNSKTNWSFIFEKLFSSKHQTVTLLFQFISNAKYFAISINQYNIQMAS